MVDVGSMRKRVQIQRNVGAAADPYNQQAESWITIGNRWAYVAPVGGRELIWANQQQGLTTLKVTFRYGSDIQNINSADRLLMGNRIFNVQSVLNDEERNESFTLIVTEDVSIVRPAAFIVYPSGGLSIAGESEAEVNE